MDFKQWIDNQYQTYYHGSNAKINQFQYSFIGTGRGHDQEGPGFYFTSDENDAKTYGTHLHKAILNLRKTVPLTGPVPQKEIVRLIRKAPNLKDTLTDWDEDPRIALQTATQSILHRDLGPHDAFQQVWYDFYHRQGADAQYLQNMVALGYDGVVLPKSGNTKHVVVFNPEIIDLVNE